MQHLHADIRVIICNYHCMILAISHDVFAKRLGSLARMTVMPDDFEICFGVTKQDIANQDLSILQCEPKRAGYCEIQTGENTVGPDRINLAQTVSN